MDNNFLELVNIENETDSEILELKRLIESISSLFLSAHVRLFVSSDSISGDSISIC